MSERRHSRRGRGTPNRGRFIPDDLPRSRAPSTPSGTGVARVQARTGRAVAPRVLTGEVIPPQRGGPVGPRGRVGPTIEGRATRALPQPAGSRAIAGPKPTSSGTGIGRALSRLGGAVTAALTPTRAADASVRRAGFTPEEQRRRTGSGPAARPSATSPAPTPRPSRSTSTPAAKPRQGSSPAPSPRATAPKPAAPSSSGFQKQFFSGPEFKYDRDRPQRPSRQKWKKK